jgi:hypothetical protein
VGLKTNSKKMDVSENVEWRSPRFDQTAYGFLDPVKTNKAASFSL